MPLEEISAEQILDFWFGELDDVGLAQPAKVGSWWNKDDDFDALICARFAALHDAIVGGQREHWLETPRSL